MAIMFDNAATKTVKVDGADFAYRVIGDADGTPVVFLHHFTAVLDDWDPAVVDGLGTASPRDHIRQSRCWPITRQNARQCCRHGRGRDCVRWRARADTGRSGRLLPGRLHCAGDSARQAGSRPPPYSCRHRTRRRRRHWRSRRRLAGRFPKGGRQKKHPKHFLFFPQTRSSQEAADAFLQRLHARKNDRDPLASNQTTQAQLAAIRAALIFARQAPICLRRLIASTKLEAAMSNVLVTGGSGFIGSHCILQLLAAGHQVRTTVRSLKREGDVRAMLKEGGAEPGDRLSFFAADLENDAGWPEAVAGCDYVLHVASPFPAERSQARGRADRARARRRAARAARRARCRRQARGADLLVRGDRLWPEAAASDAVRRDELDGPQRRRRATRT